MKRAILIADDEPGVLRFTGTVLDKAGYRPIVAEGGPQALEVFKEHQDEIDLLVLDVVMPELDGPAVAREIRLSRPEFPVLFISGYSEGRIQGIQEYRFLRKPFTAALLLRTVEEMTAKPSQAKAAATS